MHQRLIIIAVLVILLTGCVSTLETDNLTLILIRWPELAWSMPDIMSTPTPTASQTLTIEPTATEAVQPTPVIYPTWVWSTPTPLDETSLTATPFATVPLPTATPTTAPCMAVMLPSTGVNVRQGPGTNYGKIGAIPPDYPIPAVDLQSGWYRVVGTNVDGLIDGWVAGWLVRLEGECNFG